MGLGLVGTLDVLGNCCLAGAGGRHVIKTERAFSDGGSILPGAPDLNPLRLGPNHGR